MTMESAVSGLKKFFKNRMVVGILLGQFLSLMITSTGFSSSELARRETPHMGGLSSVIVLSVVASAASLIGDADSFVGDSSLIGSVAVTTSIDTWLSSAFSVGGSANGDSGDSAAGDSPTGSSAVDGSAVD
ncbi:hypothetical protein AKJ16_DCAP17401 [Drosera capensis]